MLERLANHSFFCFLERYSGYHSLFCFLDAYSGYHQIPIHPDDQSKTTFTCPYGTYAYHRMSFGLFNAPASFQRCMMSIFSDIIEKIMEVFMDDFSVYGKTFDDCLENSDKVLQRYEEKYLVLNWKKCHFVVREGIVLGHLVSERGIKVDNAKIEVIELLPPPVNVKGIRSFLGHAVFIVGLLKIFHILLDLLLTYWLRMFLLKLMMHVYKLLKFLRKHSSQRQLFNPLIGLYLFKLCVMLVVMLWGQY